MPRGRPKNQEIKKLIIEILKDPEQQAGNQETIRKKVAKRMGRKRGSWASIDGHLNDLIKEGKIERIINSRTEHRTSSTFRLVEYYYKKP